MREGRNCSWGEMSDIVLITGRSHPYLEQQIGPKKREENDGRTAKEDQLEHGDDEPGQQQTPGDRREEVILILKLIFILSDVNTV